MAVKVLNAPPRTDADSVSAICRRTGNVLWAGASYFFLPFLSFCFPADDSCRPLIGRRLMRAREEAKTVQVRVVKRRPNAEPNDARKFCNSHVPHVAALLLFADACVHPHFIVMCCFLTFKKIQNLEAGKIARLQGRDDFKISLSK